MNFLFGGSADIRCYSNYAGATFFNMFLSNSGLLIFITLVSVFLYFFLKKYKKEKTLYRILKSILWCILLYVGYGIFTLVFSSVGGFSSLVNNNGFSYSCWSQEFYFTLLVILYLVFALLLYMNIRIWHTFLDKKNKYKKLVNIIYVVAIIVLFIIFLLSKAQISILAIG